MSFQTSGVIYSTSSDGEVVVLIVVFERECAASERCVEPLVGPLVEPLVEPLVAPLVEPLVEPLVAPGATPHSPLQVQPHSFPLSPESWRSCRVVVGVGLGWADCCMEPPPPSSQPRTRSE